VLGDPVACNVDGIPQECEQTANGCFRLKDLTPDCPSDGAGQCDVDGIPQLCLINSSGDGCLAWEDQPACLSSFTCVSGNCSCTDECVLGDPITCNVDGIPQTCEDVSGCKILVDQTPACPNLGEKQCNLDQPQECLIDSVSGCLAWEDIGLACTDPLPFCQSGICKVAITNFNLTVYPLPLTQGEQLNVDLEITTNILKNMEVEASLVRTIGGNLLLNSTQSKTVDPLVSMTEIVSFRGEPDNFDTTSLSPGNHSLTVTVKDVDSTEEIFFERIFIAVVDPPQQLDVPEIHPIFAVIIGISVFLLLSKGK
jgi:hypothetical protein